MISDAKIARAIEQPSIVRLSRVFGEDYEIAGIVLVASSDWVVVHALNELHFDGIRILRRSTISDILTRQVERSIMTILKGEGRIPSTYNDRELPDLRKLRDILRFYEKRKALLTVECEGRKDEDILYIGRIARIKQTSFIMNWIDVARRWRPDKPVELRFDEVSQIAVDTEYANFFAKYAIGDSRT